MRTAVAFLLLFCFAATADPFLVAEGDSLTAGTGASPVAASNWVAQLKLQYPGVTMTNVATSGDKLVDTTIEDATNQLASAISAGRSPRTVTLLMGINDIAVNDSVANIKGYMNSWASGVKSFDASCKVAVATLFAANLNETFTTRRLELNAFIRTNLTWDYVVDLAADNRLTNYANTTYFDADGVHLNNAGYSVVAELFGSVLSAAGRFVSIYYVRTDGSDSNSGTADTAGGAYLTPQKAADASTVGSTVQIRSGTYPQKVTVTNSLSFLGESGVTLGGFEVSANNVSVRDLSLNGTNVSAGGYALYLGSGVNGASFSNITITGQYSGTNSGVGGIGMAANPNGPTNAYIDAIRIINPNYHAFVISGSGHTVTNSVVTGTTGWDAFRIVGSNIRIANNIVTNFSNTYSNLNHADIFQTFGDNGDISTNVLIEANFVANCEGYQIGNMTDDSLAGEISDWTFRNNVFANVSRTLNLYVPNTLFYNNTFYKSGRDSNWAIIYGATDAGHADNLTLYNNCFVECAADETRANVGWYGGSGVTNLVANYNLVTGAAGSDGQTKTGFTTGGLEANGINGSEPLFTDAASGTFTVQAGSPVIGAGTDLSAYFTDDFTGATRVAPWDIGAYEYLGRTATANTVNVGTLTITP